MTEMEFLVYSYYECLKTIQDKSMEVDDKNNQFLAPEHGFCGAGRREVGPDPFL